MAARRLLLVMLVLLGISTLAAALVPAPEEREDSPAPASEASPDEAPTGKLIEVEVPVSPQGDAEEIRVRPGDQLSLTVTSGQAGQVRIPRLGLWEFASPGSPARFDVLVNQRGRFDVLFEERDRPVATIISGEDE